MDDLISRQALMKEFSDFVRASNNSDFARTPTWNDAVSLVGSMPSAQQWIPCSERLPEVYEAGNSVSGMFMQSRPVLVYGVPEYESEHGFHVVTYCDDLNGITYWSTELDAVTINKVIAWMPLPEPYKERREE